MDDQLTWGESPLSVNDIEQIETTNLPSLDRHYLRLLAHCLACFKEMSNGSFSGPLPTEQDQLEWYLQQPSLVNERAFVLVLLEQFSAAGRQLEKLASDRKTSPLELTVDDLINECLKSKSI